MFRLSQGFIAGFPQTLNGAFVVLAGVGREHRSVDTSVGAWCNTKLVALSRAGWDSRLRTGEVQPGPVFAHGRSTGSRILPLFSPFSLSLERACQSVCANSPKWNLAAST
jgi:hypothetical protein